MSFFLEIEDNWEELLDVAWWNIVAVGTLDERLALEIEDGEEACHGARVLRLVGRQVRESCECTDPGDAPSCERGLWWTVLVNLMSSAKQVNVVVLAVLSA